MADTPKTPPTGSPAIPPPRPLPTIATVQASVEATLREVRGARLDIDALKSGMKALREKLDEEIARIGRLPSATSLSPVPEPPRPSMAAKAAKGTGKIGAFLMIGTGVLAVAGEVAKLWRPEYVGPIAQALRLLASLAAGEP